MLVAACNRVHVVERRRRMSLALTFAVIPSSATLMTD